MATKEDIQKAYIDYVLTNGEEPKSVYIFAKDNNFPEEEFYNFYGSFEGIEQSVWSDLIDTTIREIQLQDVWGGYSAREKGLSFFYSFFELIKSKRSFAIYSIRKTPKSISTPTVFKGFKERFEEFSNSIIQEGIETGELAERRFFTDQYKNALWMQFIFVLKFWEKDSSAGFEKTDEAIERGVNITFDLFQTSPLDNLLDYGKFIFQNSGSRRTANV